MRPKHDSGYHTPQARKIKTANLRRAESNENMDIPRELSDSFFESIMSCPIKRQVVLSLINSEKHNIEEYKRKQAAKASALSKVKKRNHCESPTALMRRRALEQQNRLDVPEEGRSDTSSRPSSRLSCVSSGSSSCASYEKLLEGVVAYVEIKSKDKDRSTCATALMISMGATVREKFTKDVTHVVFKGGSFTTYQKAKLMNVHLVSPLWIDATRRTNTKAPENKFLALGVDAYNSNVSAVCSQMQREYEELIKEELHLSLRNGTPMPSRKDLINRRRTLMTPMSSSSQTFSQVSSQDKEVEDIFMSRRKTFNILCNESPILSDILSDDDDSGHLIDGSFIGRGKKVDILSRQPEVTSDEPGSSDMDLTYLPNAKSVRDSVKSGLLTNDVEMSNVDGDGNKENSYKNESIYSKKTPKLRNVLVSKDDNVVEDSNDSMYRRKTNEINVPNSKTDTTNTTTSTNMSVLELSDKPGLKILSKNVCSASGSVTKPPDNVSNVEKSTSTNMSSLQISSDRDKVTTSMSSLFVSGAIKLDSGVSRPDNNQSGKNSVRGSGSLNSKGSFSSLNSDVMKNLMEIVDETPLKDVHVTQRRKRLVVQKKCSDAEISPSPSKKSKSAGKLGGGDNVGKVDIGKNKKEKAKKRASNVRNDGKINRTRKSEVVELSKSLDGLKIVLENENVTEKVATRKSTRNLGSSSEDSQGNSTSTSGSDKKINKTRKLYNPDDSIKEVETNDEIERQHKRIEVKKRRSNEAATNGNVFIISPNTLVTAKAKQFLDQNNLDPKKVFDKDSEESENEAKVAKKKKTAKNKKQAAKNSDADEQQDLAAEFVDKAPKGGSSKKNLQKPTTRKSTRLSQFPRKKLDMNSSNENIVPVTPVFNRRSTMEFQPKSQMSASKRLKIDKTKRPSIVCTKLHKEDIQIFNQIVRKLGGFVIEDEVSCKTTHLVAGEPKRTINMLRAMAMGCWILKQEWLLRSLEERKWLPEEDYEETDFSPAVQQSRLRRQAFGPTYTMDVFQDCGAIYIAKGSIPRCSDLRDLVALCKGRVASIPRNAAIVVGEFVKYDGVKCVKETWVLDCITFNKRMPLRKYIISSGNESAIV